MKRIFISGLFGAVGAAKKKDTSCNKYATFEANFYGQKKFILNIVASALKTYIA